MKRIVILLLVFCAGTPLLAQGNLGQSGANFLQIAVDPRGASLGGALTALTNGAEALYWNPAGAAQVENTDLLLAHTDWFLDTKLAYGGIVHNLGQDLGSIGLSVTSFYMDDEEITTVFDQDGTGEYYSAGDIAIGATYARSLTSSFSFGITVKYVQEFIWNETADQVAFDVGSVYKAEFLNIRLGMAIRNVAGKLSFSGDDIDRKIAEEKAISTDNNPRIERLSKEFRLPQIFQMGVAFEPMEFESSTWLVMADVNVPSDNEQRITFATEYGLNNLAFLRAAYKMNYDIGEFSFGGGLALGMFGAASRLDYAFAEHGVLGDVHRFALGISL